MTEPTLRERLQAGPGSRELSDAFLRELGFHAHGPAYARVWTRSFPNGEEEIRDLDCSQVTDHALAMVPEGLTYDVDATVPEAGVDFGLHKPNRAMRLTVGTAYGDKKTQLCRAICLAILAAKEAGSP